MAGQSEVPNILFIMCDQLRADAIAALGNSTVKTPNIDRLVRRGVSFSKAYSPCPVCVPARYTIRTGCESYNTGVYQNDFPYVREGQPENMEERCGIYLPRFLKERGYRTFGVGKSHTLPWNEDTGFEINLYAEDMYLSEEQRRGDHYAMFIATEHPEYDFIEQLHGERTEMYYIPQMSPLPAELTSEAWAADRAIELIKAEDKRPYFGFVSFLGPHPPLAPPIPYNRMYNPDNMDNPIKGNIAIDHMDKHLPWMNYAIWAEDINDSLARIIKARYYGEVSYIDACIGRILDCVEARDDSDNTLICFFSDHGDHLGDHHSWQKESYFEASCRVPFLVSWPKRLPKGLIRDELVSLTDLFGIAAQAAGSDEVRDGVDVLGIIERKATPREYLFGYFGNPGKPYFKIMVRERDWKYIYFANGGNEQLFNVTEDPFELKQMADKRQDIVERLRNEAILYMKRHGLSDNLEDGKLKKFKLQEFQRIRAKQFDISRGVADFTIK